MQIFRFLWTAKKNAKTGKKRVHSTAKTLLYTALHRDEGNRLYKPTNKETEYLRVLKGREEFVILFRGHTILG